LSSRSPRRPVEGTTKRRSRIDPELINMLEEAEVDYELKECKSHVQVKVGGRVIVTSPRSGNWDNRASNNARAALRRHLKGLEL
jgi:hypothetical protein